MSRRRLALRSLAIACVAVAAGARTAHAEWEPHDVGDIVIVDPLNYDRAIQGGGSSVAFALRLPGGATCPGDSQHDNWRVRSFLVPADFDMGDIVWGDADPAGENQWSLYGVDTTPVLWELLLPNQVAGEPGRIPEIRPLTFGVFTEGLLVPGHYRLGLACMYFQETAMYWDAEVTVEADLDDQPAQLRWTVVSTNVTPGSSSSDRTAVALGAVAVLVVVGGLASYRLRRRQRRAPLVKEVV